MTSSLPLKKLVAVTYEQGVQPHLSVRVVFKPPERSGDTCLYFPHFVPLQEDRHSDIHPDIIYVDMPKITTWSVVETWSRQGYVTMIEKDETYEEAARRAVQEYLMQTKKIKSSIDKSAIPAICEFIRQAALNAMNSLSYDYAYQILDLALSYGFPEGLPPEAHSLWSARCKINIMKGVDIHSSNRVWDRLRREVTDILNTPITVDVGEE